ncbi:FRG domain-containing protein [Desulfolithobacter sp.]
MGSEEKVQDSGSKKQVAGYKICANSWDEAVAIFNSISRKNPLWLFRGEADSQWTLKTKFEREAENHELDSYYYNTCERNIITGFQRQSRQYLHNLPAEDEYIDWMALIQHYGGPTRLLDFTYSFYVAAFFAIQNAKSESAIWAVNANSLIRQNDCMKGQTLQDGYRKIVRKYVHLANDVLKEGQKFREKDRKQDVYLVEPFIQETRLSIQQGLFLFPADIESSFMCNLAKAFGAESKDHFDNDQLIEFSFDELNEGDVAPCLVKIMLSDNLRYEAVNQLWDMNISDATLFPGLDGFSRSLTNHFHSIKWTLTKPRK